MLIYLVAPIIVNVVMLTSPKKNPKNPYNVQPANKKSKPLVTHRSRNHVSPQELEVWFLSHVWCPAPMSQDAIS